MIGSFDYTDSSDAATDHLTSVTRMLCHEEIVTLIRVHSGHFTDAAAIRIAGELADEPGKTVACHKHGASCKIVSDSAAGYYFVTMSRADWYQHDVTVYPELYGPTFQGLAVEIIATDDSGPFPRVRVRYLASPSTPAEWIAADALYGSHGKTGV